MDAPLGRAGANGAARPGRGGGGDALRTPFVVWGEEGAPPPPRPGHAAADWPHARPLEPFGVGSRIRRYARAGPRPLRPQPHRPPPRRRRPDRPVQLVVRPPPRRRLHPPDRGYGSVPLDGG